MSARVDARPLGVDAPTAYRTYLRFRARDNAERRITIAATAHFFDRRQRGQRCSSCGGTSTRLLALACADPLAADENPDTTRLWTGLCRGCVEAVVDAAEEMWP